jgi:hypothetical protein
VRGWRVEYGRAAPHPVGHLFPARASTLPLTEQRQLGALRPVHESGTHKREVICCVTLALVVPISLPKIHQPRKIIRSTSRPSAALFSSVSKDTLYTS